eukprot:4970612-Amphidinium_carterae.3
MTSKTGENALAGEREASGSSESSYLSLRSVWHKRGGINTLSIAWWTSNEDIVARGINLQWDLTTCLLYTSPSPRDRG